MLHMANMLPKMTHQTCPTSKRVLRRVGLLHSQLLTSHSVRLICPLQNKSSYAVNALINSLSCILCWRRVECPLNSMIHCRRQYLQTYRLFSSRHASCKGGIVQYTCHCHELSQIDVLFDLYIYYHHDVYCVTDSVHHYNRT